MRVHKSILTIAVLLCAWASFASATQYTCPMHPHYIANEPGNCPICGMDLVEVKQDTETREEGGGVYVSPEVQYAMGVRTALTEPVRFGREIRSFGLISENERLRQEVSSRVDGWVEKLYVTALGDQVEKGSPLFALYSPELIAAQQDLLNALRANSPSRQRAAEGRLRSLGIPKQTVKTLIQSKKLMNPIEIHAPFDGVVSSLNIREGSYIKPGTELLTLQNYDQVWINVSVAEQDLRFISLGGVAMVEFPNLPGISKDAAVDYIYPTIEGKSRTGKVRLLLDNSDGLFKPGSYVDVYFKVQQQKRLAVPREALLRDALGYYVILAHSGGHFRAQRVDIGIRSKGYVEITNGLSNRERVVISGQFLLDSESNLRESFTKLERLAKPFQALEISDDQWAMIDHLVDSALYLHDVIKGERSLQPNYLQPSIDVTKVLDKPFNGTRLIKVLDQSRSALESAQQSIADRDLQNALDKLTFALYPFITEASPERYAEKGLTLFQDGNKRRYWLQTSDRSWNPYRKGKGIVVPWEKMTLKENMTEQKNMSSREGGAHANH